MNIIDENGQDVGVMKTVQTGLADAGLDRYQSKMVIDALISVGIEFRYSGPGPEIVELPPAQLCCWCGAAATHVIEGTSTCMKCMEHALSFASI